jgi:hypothetical protein
MSTEPEVVTYDDGLETNIYEIAKQICVLPPKPPCSIQLVMEDDTETSVEYDLIKDFTLGCMRVLFGQDATPCDLNEEQFDRLNQYVKSVGYQINVTKEENNESYIFKISFQRYQSSKPNPFGHLKKYMT